VDDVELEGDASVQELGGFRKLIGIFEVWYLGSLGAWVFLLSPFLGPWTSPRRL